MNSEFKNITLSPYMGVSRFQTMFQLSLVVALIHCCVQIQAETNVFIPVGQPYVDIYTPGHPSKPLPFNSYMQWNFQVDQNATIKIQCNDIRMGQNEPWTDDCEPVYLSFIEENNEKKICGLNIRRFQYESKGPKLIVKFVANSGSGFIKCVAQNTAEPPANQIEMSPNGRIVIVSTPTTPIPYYDGVWVLQSPPDTKISFQCSFSLGTKVDPCFTSKMILDNGEDVKEYCGADDIIVFSKQNYAKIRIHLNEFGDSTVKCLVQAVTGPHHNQYKNIEFEEIDSSEHGTTDGVKNTTCDCGRANKSPARVTYGTETGENEFPWMVLLHIYFPVGTSGYFQSFSCGASIITRRHVLTAAHCVVDKKSNTPASPELVQMALAEHHRHISSGKEVHITAEQLFVHENYLKQRTHDIAVILTNGAIEYSSFIGPICLSLVELPVINRRIQIMGWGQTEHGRGSNVLRKSRATVIDRLLCNMDEWEICTRAEPSATCFGDSGGPQVWVDPDTNRYTQVSLASRAAKDCRSFPNTQTDVYYFYKWIEDVINQTDPSEIICHKID